MEACAMEACAMEACAMEAGTCGGGRPRPTATVQPSNGFVLGLASPSRADFASGSERTERMRRLVVLLAEGQQPRLNCDCVVWRCLFGCVCLAVFAWPRLGDPAVGIVARGPSEAHDA